MDNNDGLRPSQTDANGIIMSNSPVRRGRSRDEIDASGYRPNVGIILANPLGQLFWARRIGRQEAWQFPQGGIQRGESPEQALFRELHEEIGLEPNDVRILACTYGWLHYRLPKRLVRNQPDSHFVGQKQKWFLLMMQSEESRVRVDHSRHPEFSQWRWVSYWHPLSRVVEFKREVYRRALHELSQPLAEHLSG